MIQVLFNTILPIFSLIAVGFLLRTKGVIDPGYAKTANQIVYNVAIPAMLFSESATSPMPSPPMPSEKGISHGWPFWAVS
jgi:predicted permease